MRKLVCLSLVALFAATFVACATNKPGIDIEDMTVEENSRNLSTPVLSKYCGDYYSFSNEPGTQSFACEVPLSPRVEIGFGWGAKDTSVFESNWNAMTWELYIDEVQINLDEFKQQKLSGKDSAGHQVTGLGWSMDLVNLSPGEHNLRLLWKSETAIDDGFDVYAPGIHENIVNFTVQEK